MPKYILYYQKKGTTERFYLCYDWAWRPWEVAKWMLKSMTYEEMDQAATKASGDFGSSYNIPCIQVEE